MEMELKYTVKWKRKSREIEYSKRKVLILFQVTTRIPEDIETTLKTLEVDNGKL